MSAILAFLRGTRWASTKFWLTCASFSVFTALLWYEKLGQDNYLLLAGGTIGAYLGVNLLQHRTYANGGQNGNPGKP